MRFTFAPETILPFVCPLIIVLVLLETFEGLVLPRRISRPLRFAAIFYQRLWRVWRGVGRVLKPHMRDDWMAVFGPMSVLILFVVWSLWLIVAFAGLHYGLHSPVSAPEGTPTFATYVYLSATTFITLGFGDVAPKTTLARLITDVEAGIGFGFLAVVIAYLPVLYQTFSRREVEIGLLDARASTPPSAGELFRRIAPCPDLGDLNHTLRNWERWSAELLESHLSYPSLMYWRSQHDKQSWLATLTLILDVSALIIAAAPETGVASLRYQARLTFAMTRHAAVDLSLFLRGRIPSQPPRMTQAEQEGLFGLLLDSGMPLENTPEAHERLTELRALYEPSVQALSIWLGLPLPTWPPNPEAHDHWRMSTDPKGHFFSIR
jgi:hypothetical protein